MGGQPCGRCHLGRIDARWRRARRRRGPRLIGGARQLYDRQDFNFAGLWGKNDFIEDYIAEVRGRPLGALHLVTFNAEGQAQHIAVHYRPLSSLLLFSRLLRERFAGTPYADHFLAGEVE